MTEDRRQNTAPNLHIVPTVELLQILAGLSSNEQFKKLIELFEKRATGLALWAHTIHDETTRLWAGGRVQELSDILTLCNQCHALLKQFQDQKAAPTPPSEI